MNLQILSQKTDITDNPKCPWMNVNCHMSESGFSIHSALVSKDSNTENLPSQKQLGKEVFCSSSISQL